MRIRNKKKPTIIIFLLDIFSVRNFLFTPLWDHFKSSEHVNLVIVSNSESHRDFIETEKASNVKWEHLGKVSRSRLTKLSKGRWKFAVSSVLGLISKSIEKVTVELWRELHVRVLFRFNHLKRFQTHQLKLRLPEEEKSKPFGEPQYLGWPWPNSKVFYKILFRIYTSSLWKSPKWLRFLLDEYSPDLAVIAFPQSVMGFTVNRELQKRKIKTLAYINSWDQPTTKGPLPPGIVSYMVWNNQMRSELMGFHEVKHDEIKVVGAAQLDLYRDVSLQMSREDFLSLLKLDPSRKLVVLGTYNERLGPHEPDIAAYVARKICKSEYKIPASLCIRCHPHDSEWKQRFGHLQSEGNVYVQHGSSFDGEAGVELLDNPVNDLKILINLIMHADIVINSASTLTLDAIAFDRPVINIGFDGSGKLPQGSFVFLRYQYDHFSKIIKAGGTKLAKSYEELDDAVNEYLAAPSLDRKGREDVRKEQLEPFDGRSCERIHKEMMRWL